MLVFKILIFPFIVLTTNSTKYEALLNLCCWSGTFNLSFFRFKDQQWRKATGLFKQMPVYNFNGVDYAVIRNEVKKKLVTP